jgi:hypothetical protein
MYIHLCIYIYMFIHIFIDIYIYKYIQVNKYKEKLVIINTYINIHQNRIKYQKSVQLVQGRLHS